MSKLSLSLVIFGFALLAGAVHQLAEGQDLSLALALDFALPLALVPMVAIYFGARALGFIGGLLLSAVVLAELLVPWLAGLLSLAVILYALCYGLMPQFRQGVRQYLELIGLADPPSSP